jgi:GT2 family glycosyltransferase
MAVAAAPVVHQESPSARQLRPTAAVPKLSIIIVNYCQWRNTARLTKQLRRSRAARRGAAEIVIVDNHSPRHPLMSKLRRLDGVSLRRFGRNRGFAKAVNEGCRLGRGEWLLLLNPDTSVPPGFLDRVAAMMSELSAKSPRAGIIGLGIDDPDGSTQPSCGPLPTLTGTLSGLLRSRATRKCRPTAMEQRTSVPWATGCALLIRRDCLREVGGFDEDFFLYYEDVDFCRRARDRGWEVCFEPELRITHHTPLHSRPVPAALRLMTRHALLTYGLKHWPRWHVSLMGGIIWLESGLRQAFAWLRGRTEDVYFHRQTRRIVGDLLAGREAKARTRIRAAAESLAPCAAAQDGQTR